MRPSQGSPSGIPLARIKQRGAAVALAMVCGLGSSCASARSSGGKQVHAPRERAAVPASAGGTPRDAANNASSPRGSEAGAGPAAAVLSDVVGKPLPDIAFDVVIPLHVDPAPASDPSVWRPKQALGKVVALEFLRSWCDECLLSMRQMELQYVRLRARGLLVVGVDVPSTDGGASGEGPDLRAFLDAVGESFPIVAASSQTLSRLGIRELPATVLLDRSGVVRYAHAGLNSENARAVERLVQENAGEAPGGVSQPAAADDAGTTAWLDVPAAEEIDLAHLSLLSSSKGRLGPNHRGQVRQRTLHVEGGVPAEIVRRFLLDNAGQYRLCYDDGLRRNPKLKGKLGLRITVDSDRTVEATLRAGTEPFGDAEVVECVIRNLRVLAFPQPVGASLSIDYELEFTR